MSTTTTNYNLVKPDYTDIADIAVINGNSDIIDSVLKTLADSDAAKQPATDNSLTTTSKNSPGAINELDEDVNALQRSLTTGAYTATSLADLESWLVARCEEMENYTARIFTIFPNFTSSTFFGGAIQIAIATRRTSGAYRVCFPNICGDAYYYSSAWHYSKATMSTITP